MRRQIHTVRTRTLATEDWGLNAQEIHFCLYLSFTNDDILYCIIFSHKLRLAALKQIIGASADKRTR